MENGIDNSLDWKTGKSNKVSLLKNKIL